MVQTPSVKIMLVDDDEINNYINAKMLRRFFKDVQIDICLNGEEAIHLLKANLNTPPDIILLDINMPVMNGWAFIHAYQQLSPNIHKNISIYLLSSSVFDDDIRKSRDYPFIKDYIVKPFHPDKVKKIISDLEQQA